MFYSSLSSGVKSICDVRMNLVIINTVQVAIQVHIVQERESAGIVNENDARGWQGRRMGRP